MSSPSSFCPNCGAPVKFLYSNAVQTTCEFCKSILVRRDLQLEKVGERADIPVDASPIQILTEGIYRGRSFQVVGRILYKYEQGDWNEWHCVFSDGSSGWLSDALAEYAMSFLAPQHPSLPDASQMHRGLVMQFQGNNYEATTLTRAYYAGVQGELPFEYWDKTECLFADFRTHGEQFATVDYSEAPPLLFLGEWVDFDQLKLKYLRDFEGW